MSINMTMPALSPTMTEGTLAKWLVKEGDTIRSGDVIAEIETDKATMEVEAIDEGTIGKILVPEGSQDVAVNSVIAIILEDGETEVAEATESTIPSLEKSTPTPQKSKKEEDKNKEEPAKQGKGKGKGQNTVSSSNNAPPHDVKSKNSTRILASPLAKRIAKQEGLELSAMKDKGSGPHGRIIKRDVTAMLSSNVTTAPSQKTESKSGASDPSASASPSSTGTDAKTLADNVNLPYETVSTNRTRKIIAQRLTEAKQSIPHFYLTIDLNIDALLTIRQQINKELETEGIKISVNDLLIKATAMALIDNPHANASWQEGEILYYKRADISVAVAIDDGLITPIIQDARNKSLRQISTEIKDKAIRAQQGKLKPSEYQGGTFTISNLGMYGIKQFDAVINPPQGAILAIGAAEKRPIVKDDGTLGVATIMSVTLSCDHRVIDGAIGAKWLQTFKKRLENPISMLV